MSLSTNPAFSLLQDQFVCGYDDIENRGGVGASGRHECDGNAVNTSNGAGPRNVQIFILAADGTVLHCLPGYWHSKDLASELVFAQKLDKVWADPSLSLEQKDALFRQMQLGHIAEHSQAEQARSHMQGFDISYEKMRHPNSDIFQTGTGIAKTTDVIMHERMAQQPFVSINKFDVRAFSGYGNPMYDKNENELTGKSWTGKEFIGNDSRAHPLKNAIFRNLLRL